MVQIGSKIRSLRELKGYSQEYMAQQLGLSQTSYSRIELGETKLTIEKLQAIGAILEIDPIDIMRFDQQCFFNNYDQKGGNANALNMYINNFDKEREQYEARIKQLQEEVDFLRKLVEQKIKA